MMLKTFLAKPIPRNDPKMRRKTARNQFKRLDNYSIIRLEIQKCTTYRPFWAIAVLRAAYWRKANSRRKNKKSTAYRPFWDDSGAACGVLA